MSNNIINENIKLVNLKNQNEMFKEKYLKEVSEIIDDSSYILGSKVSEFEKKFGDYLETDYCVGVGNGTDALEMAINAAGIREGDEVIIQANTFISTALAVSNSGAKLILVDCREEDMMINHDIIQKKITEKTKALIVVHLYGCSPNMGEIIKIVIDNDLILIEDTAQAHGGKYDNYRLGTIGDFGCFSFYPSKNLGCVGDGGAVVTSSKYYFDKLKKLRNIGSVIKYEHEIKGRNSRLDPVQAVMLTMKLDYLDEWNECRRNLVKYYMENLKNINEIKLSPFSDCSVYHLFVIRLKCEKMRDDLKNYLQNNNIESGIHYPIPIHKTQAYRELNNDVYPVTEKCSKTILSLPMYPELKLEEVKKICETIFRFFSES